MHKHNVVERIVRVGSPIPGVKSKEMISRQRDIESGAVSYPRRLPIAIQRANGSYVEDVDGNVFIDFLTGAGSLPLGHNPPTVIAAAKKQMDSLCHGLDFPTETKMRFTEAQRAMLPGPMRDQMKIHYCGPTGSDAVEAAIKLCKIYSHGDEILTFQGGYHGCSHGTLSVTGNRQMKMPIANRVPGVHFFPYSYCYRCSFGLSRDNCSTNCAVYFERALSDSNGGIGKPAAVLLELVQGEGGVIPADKGFIQTIRAATKALKIPLIVDEIQTGCGRTGTWFAFEQYDIEPDVIVSSKGLSGMGAPVALMFYRKEMDVWGPGTHIGTFRGNQVAFAAGLEFLRLVAKGSVLKNVKTRSAEIEEFFRANAQEWAIVGDVRGLGLMWGIEIIDPSTGRADSLLASRVQEASLQNGLILELGGRDDTVVRLLPPLNVSASTLAEALGILQKALYQVQGMVDQRLQHAFEDYEI